MIWRDPNTTPCISHCALSSLTSARGRARRAESRRSVNKQGNWRSYISCQSPELKVEISGGNVETSYYHSVVEQHREEGPGIYTHTTTSIANVSLTEMSFFTLDLKYSPFHYGIISRLQISFHENLLFRIVASDIFLLVLKLLWKLKKRSVWFCW